MANQHELLGALAFLTSRPAVLTMVCLTALNLLGLIANALFYARNQRRWRRVQARERRLDAGPVTAAVGHVHAARREGAHPEREPRGRVRVPELPSLLVEPIVRAALLEDLGRAGDITTDAIVPPDAPAIAATVAARKPGRIAGLGAAIAAFRLLDPDAQIEVVRPDGSDVVRGDAIAEVRGSMRGILSAERTALNFLGQLSGIATATAALVEAVRGTRATIACTRKTTPGLRTLEKYAIRVGGGLNHRFGLDDAVLIKDNHIAAVGGIRPALERARAERRSSREDRDRGRHARAAARGARRRRRRRGPARQHVARPDARSRGARRRTRRARSVGLGDAGDDRRGRGDRRRRHLVGVAHAQRARAGRRPRLLAAGGGRFGRVLLEERDQIVELM